VKYVITGASTYGVKNMGDDAMLANMVQGIKREDPDAKITFLARHPDAEYDRLFGFNSLNNLDHESSSAAFGRFFYGFNKGDSTENIIKLKEYIEEADLLIIGGNSFMEVSENKFLRGVSSYAATLAVLAKFCGTPYALYGLNIVDPVKNPLTEQHAKFLCENAISVTVREKQVLAYLSDMNIDLGNVEVCGDPAFGMESEYDEESVNEILKKNNIFLKNNKKILTVSYRIEYWQNDENKFDRLAERMAGIIDAIVEKYDFQVLFIPNCTYTVGNKWQDDRLVNKLISKKLKNINHVFFIEDELNVFETYSMFSLTDLHISNRRHSNVFAAMHGKTFFSISISHATHISALLDSLECPELKINIDNDIEKIIDSIHPVITDNSEILVKLKTKTEELKKNAQTYISVILKNLFECYGSAPN